MRADYDDYQLPVITRNSCQIVLVGDFELCLRSGKHNHAITFSTPTHKPHTATLIQICITIQFDWQSDSLMSSCFALSGCSTVSRAPRGRLLLRPQSQIFLMQEAQSLWAAVCLPARTLACSSSFQPSACSSRHPEVPLEPRAQGHSNLVCTRGPRSRLLSTL